MLNSKNYRRRRCTDSLVVFLLVFIFLKGSYGGTIIAKSDLTVCDNFDNNPHNVVDNKSCKKKLIITQSVLSSQDGTETLYFTANKIYDRVEKEDARLYNPFIIKISKSAVNLVYPFYYETSVNNHPHEEVRTDKRCNDGFNAEATCGFARDHLGNKIWDSQGFCCQCSFYDSVPRWLRKILYGGHTNRYYRGGQGGLCGYAHKHNENDKYSHCMRMDKLWYDVFSIGVHHLSFIIKIQAYDQVDKIVNNQTISEWVDGGKILLNYNKRSAVGQYGRLIATFHGTFASTEEFQTFKDHYFLLIPKETGIDPAHLQLTNGFRDYMIIPSRKISLQESHDSCDMVGVSYSSFRKQGGGSGAVGSGCTQKMNSCFGNQPKDLFEEDLALRVAGKRPEYFVERYGNCIGVNREGSSDTLGLVYQLDKTITSLLTLEVSADDMILIYNKASGTIIKSFATNFDALSRDGKMTIMVQNTGLVTADFYVVFAGCSEGVHLNEERTSSINPKAIHVFTYDIDVYHKAGKRHYCSVELYDARRKLQDSKNVTFLTFSPCVCLQHCVCKCNEIAVDENEDLKSEGGDECNQPDNPDDDYSDEEEEKKSEESVFTKTMNAIFKVIDRRYLILILLLFLGVVKAVLGRQSLCIAKLGLGGLRTGEKVTKTINGEEVVLVFNAAMNLVEPETERTVVVNNADWDFYVNIFFFILLPVLLVVKTARITKRIISRFKPTPGEQLPMYAPRSAQVAAKTAQVTTVSEIPAKQAPKSKRIVPKMAGNAQKKGFPKLMGNTPKLKKSAPKKSK